MQRPLFPQTPKRKNEGQYAYEKDLDILISSMMSDMPPDLQPKLAELEDRLKQLRDKNLLKINHSVLELVVAKHLIVSGYEVQLEHELESGLTCDVWAEKGLGSCIVEVETGYVPPSHALDPVDYIKARIASKIARYSNYCQKFILGAPPHYIMPIPRMLATPARFRSEDEMLIVKRYCDMYYSNPQVSREEILNAHIHSVMVIDVDQVRVREIDPVEYIDRVDLWYK
jgi:hypothetical protein